MSRASSDAVFAIAIALLVLELKVPDLGAAGVSPGSLGKALLQQWPSYVGLVTSFFTILASRCFLSVPQRSLLPRRVIAICLDRHSICWRA
jgi:hypothetical protein